MKWYEKWANGVDYFFNKMIPKKLIVWIVCTVLIFVATDVPAEYWYVTLAYMGANAIKGFANKGGLK